MSSETLNRTCGSCGEPVGATDVTCPRCGALLAAYEPPRGAERPAEPVSPAPVAPASPMYVSPATPEPRSAPERDALAAPVVVEADSADPQTAAIEPGNTPTSTTVSLTSAREKAQPVPRRPEPAQRGKARPADQISGSKPDQRRMSLPPAPTRSPGTASDAFRHLAIGFIITMLLLGIFDFDLIPMMALAAVTISLLGLMRAAAKASGRKTTSMFDPNRRDGWGR